MFTRQTQNLDLAISSSPSSFLQSLSPSQTPSNNVMLIDTFVSRLHFSLSQFIILQDGNKGDNR